jgi:hypothetical protein
MNKRLRLWLREGNQITFALWAIAGAFITYFSMYAFRKPVSAAVFADETIWGLDYKVIALIAQVCGYAISKFAGIIVISEMPSQVRIRMILILIGGAWLALLGFAIVPAPYNVAFLFLNGLPLGMIWGVVFSFLEGRRFTELLGAGLCASFIISSGTVKSVGRLLIQDGGISEFWMPFATGLVFLVPLFIGVWMLSLLPEQTEADVEQRSHRVPMTAEDRKSFFRTFTFGIIMTVFIYVLLTVFRDIRDNFTVEIWSALGFGETPHILATAEIPVAIGVLGFISLMSFVRSNRTGFFLNFHIITGTGLLLIVATALFEAGQLGPISWMILNGFAMYLAYIAYHTFLFERWIAVFRNKSNIGYLMYIADAFGYVGSITIMFMKNFGPSGMGWLEILIILAYFCGAGSILFSIVCYVYFKAKVKRLVSEC